jgi:hypothetical protein
MIISVYRPIKKDKEIICYDIVDKNSIYQKGFTELKVTYKCDDEMCKTPDKVYSIDRGHLNEKRSKTVNDKVQICRSCQMRGNKNPRFNDNRSWEELMGLEKSILMKEKYRQLYSGDNNTSKKDETKKKKNQFIVNFENVSEFVSKFGFTLSKLDGDNKNAFIDIKCCENHKIKIKYINFKIRPRCRFCYYESMRIPYEQIEKFEKYSKIVRSLTRFQFNNNKHLINDSDLKINDPSGYHVDHIYSIIEGFLNEIDPKVISSYVNLQIMLQNDNLSKSRKCDISIDELYRRYNSI